MAVSIAVATMRICCIVGYHNYYDINDKVVMKIPMDGRIISSLFIGREK